MARRSGGAGGRSPGEAEGAFMGALAPGVRFVDLRFQGVSGVIATAVLDARSGVALVDPGPASCLDALRAGLSAMGIGAGDLAAVLLTHIHLDHAGATGSLVRENPRVAVYVHERGAPHLVDPRRLVESATRLYGSDMDRLWGPILAVPESNVRPLAGGERIEAGGRRFEVAYTPGHASHHVSYFDAAGGMAFVGDTAGVAIGASRFVMPPTPPPDIDLALWNGSLDRLLAWEPAALFLTHFGAVERPRPHVEALRARLERAAGIVRRALELFPDPADEARAAARFREEMGREMQRHMSEADVRSYELAVPLDHCFLGLARYWRKRGVSGGAAAGTGGAA
jgi:glyoxylase-like metal-dependent hydrolase (beta-lactamase superfamily II)